MKDTYIKGVAAATGGSVGAMHNQTGQTTSYRTGDDGDLEEGRDVDFLTLPSNNPFGTTARFTDELGNQTYTNDIAIDWSTYDGSTVLGWYINPRSGNWNTGIDTSLTTSVGSFSSGWYLPNITQLQSIINYGVSIPLNYAPFSETSTNFWLCSTTRPTTTSQSMSLAQSGGFAHNIVSTNKTSTYAYYSVRNFTVTGTTLT